jgi:hypothetical protein
LNTSAKGKITISAKNPTAKAIRIVFVYQASVVLYDIIMVFGLWFMVYGF